MRYFIIKRSDEPAWLAIATFALGPVAGLWRQVFLRPLMFYAYLTFWKVGNWGTREEVGAVGLNLRPDREAVPRSDAARTHGGMRPLAPVLGRWMQGQAAR